MPLLSVVWKRCFAFKPAFAFPVSAGAVRVSFKKHAIESVWKHIAEMNRQIALYLMTKEWLRSDIMPRDELLVKPSSSALDAFKTSLCVVLRTTRRWPPRQSLRIPHQQYEPLKDTRTRCLLLVQFSAVDVDIGRSNDASQTLGQFSTGVFGRCTVHA